MKILRKILKIGFILTTIFLIGVTGAYLYAYLSPEIQIKNANAFVMYDNAETVFYQGSGSQEWTELEQISDTLIQATIYTEDKHFYNHHGFDILRIIKALYTNFISGKTVQGASTISQQYAKNLFLDFDKTWERKWKEMWITLRLETHYSKDEILEGYLNTINYGHGMYGIGNASYFYFGKSPKDLTLAESAMLVGIPKSPSNYSPISNYDLAKQRQRYVLNTLVNNGMISKEEADQAYAEKLTIIGEKSENDLSKIMYYQDAVMKELKTIKAIPEDLMETGGLKIYTNLDMETQLNMVENIQNTLAVEDELQTASVMMEAKTGKVIALMGGKDYNTSQYNRAISSKRQVGSAMKPLLYYAALENGFTSSTSFLSQATTFTFANNKTYSPQNYGEVYANKPISLAAAIAYSDNIYAVKTHMFLGEETLVNMAKRLGITSELDEVPSLALGTSEISMSEMVGAYAAFANEGYKVKPHLIQKVVDNEGNILYEADEELSLAMFEYLITQLKENGFEHYEISNFGKPGFHSRHNSSYWNNIPYLGCGAAAHSLIGTERMYNVANLNQYMDNMNQYDKGNLNYKDVCHCEELSFHERYNDRIITCLRTAAGLNLKELETDFGTGLKDYCLKMAAPHLNEKTLQITDTDRYPQGVLKLTHQGIFLSDGIMSDLLWVE